jgi:uncharacterized OsmC-like protein
LLIAATCRKNAMSETTIRDAIEKLDAAIAADPEKARASHAGAIATLAGGLRFTVTGPHGERLDTDMAKGVGGEASGPSPGWALRAALASCTGTVIALRAATLGLALDRLEVSVDSDGDLRGMLGSDDTVSAALTGLRMRVAIEAQNADRDALEDLVRWADAHSPVACTLRQALPIAVVVE